MADDDLFGTDTAATTRRRRHNPNDEAPAGAAGALAAAIPPAVESAAEVEDTVENLAAEKISADPATSRILDDAQRLKLSQIVDYRISAHKRGRITAEEVRRVLLEVIANT